jgi:hypothetical protein
MSPRRHEPGAPTDEGAGPPNLGGRDMVAIAAAPSASLFRTITDERSRPRRPRRSLRPRAMNGSNACSRSRGIVKGELLRLLEAERCFVTTDANGGTQGAAKAMLEAHADDTLALKGNRGPLDDATVDAFDLPAKGGPNLMGGRVVVALVAPSGGPGFVRGAPFGGLAASGFTNGNSFCTDGYWPFLEGCVPRGAL